MSFSFDFDLSRDLALLVTWSLIIPGWFVFKKAGMTPFWTLLLVLPGIGLYAVMALLAYRRWPALDREPSRETSHA